MKKPKVYLHVKTSWAMHECSSKYINSLVRDTVLAKSYFTWKHFGTPKTDSPYAYGPCPPVSMGIDIGSRTTVKVVIWSLVVIYQNPFDLWRIHKHWFLDKMFIHKHWFLDRMFIHKHWFLDKMLPMRCQVEGGSHLWGK